MKTAAENIDMFPALVGYLAYVWCASRFFVRHLQRNRREGAVFGGLLFVGRQVMAVCLEKNYVPYILYALCRHILFIGFVMAVFRGEEREKKLLAAVVLETMTGLIWNFAESFFCFAGLIAVYQATGGKGMAFIGEWGQRGILLLTYTAGIWLINLLSVPLSSVFSDKRGRWYLYMAVPLLGIILAVDLANWGASNGIMVQSRGEYGMYANQLFSHGAMCGFTGLAAAAAGIFVFGMDKLYREVEIREQYRCQTAYYQMMEEQYSRAERLRHDMKNHIIALENLVKNRQWEQAGSYLKDMEKAGGLGAGEEASGSLVMDGLLYHKRIWAEDRGISWQCNARIPKNSPIKEMDLCIIAGNILDNAIEGCERLRDRERFIRVYMGKVKKCFFLEVQNSTDMEGSPQVGKSRKTDSQSHGLGLANVKAAAADYNGTVHMEAVKGVFTISVLLPMNEEVPGRL